MPKTLTEIKKTSAYSEEFEKAVSFIKITREYTPAVVAAIEKLIHAPPPKHPKPNELERLAQAAQKYMPYFVSGCFYETLQATANVCNSVAKHEREVQMEAFQRVVTPIKSWILEDYPRLMKAILDIKKCYQLKDKMDRTMASAEARRTPERVAKAHEAKNKHKQFFERIENEYQFEQKAKNAFSAAFTKCEAEIEAGSAAIKELRKGTTTVEETEVKESNKEGEKDANAEEQADSKKDDKKEEEKVSSKKSSQKLEKKDECHKEDAKDNESAVSMKDKVNEKETEKESAENPGDKKKEESSKDLSNLT
ncbi:unnamed protein product [Thelazia callipaeda]|uniref:BAR domain-containing protein n=1 Tax=Thelazia callipaeda TaxID=103827 RepID=A0A0N5DAS8_THECL|nr:unnamed protein product [Thelazia callipaeda]